MITPPLSKAKKKFIICGVTNLSPEICKKIREARREAKLSQSVVAAEVGCKQSALSMFEQGDGTKLNDEAIGRLLKKFNIKAAEIEGSGAAAAVAALAPVRSQERGFCPNPRCPSHYAYEVDGRAFLKPNRAEQDPAGGRFCAICGEVLEKRCPNCGAAVHDGAVCTHCGEPYIPLA